MCRVTADLISFGEQLDQLQIRQTGYELSICKKIVGFAGQSLPVIQYFICCDYEII